jgi:hypothetical protein
MLTKKKKSVLDLIEEDVMKNGGVLSRVGIALTNQSDVSYDAVKKAVAKARLRISQEATVKT